MQIDKLETVPHPVVKWVGGKKQLLPVIKAMIPEKFKTYYEPFCGGAALFFALKPKKAVLNDYNRELINLYCEIKDNTADFIKVVERYETEYNSLPDMDAKNNYYYARRDDFNNNILKWNRDKETDLKMAALFVFLNKAGWNGVYRLNQSGLFNVPTGKHKTVHLIDRLNISVISQIFRNGTTLMTGDFTDSVKNVEAGDFVFIDSPYFDTFTQYQAGGFSVHDHLRVARMFETLTEKGAYCMLTNSNTKFIKNLYKNHHQKVVHVQRSVNRNKDERHGEEVIITNYASPDKSSKPRNVDLMQLDMWGDDND